MLNGKCRGNPRRLPIATKFGHGEYDVCGGNDVGMGVRGWMPRHDVCHFATMFAIGEYGVLIFYI
jgi:hypothetical protein